MDAHSDETRLAAFLGTAARLGYAFGGDGCVIERRKPRYQTPWAYVGSRHHTRCRLWHHGVFPCFGLAPSPCHQCFKVVVRPRTLEELLQLLEVQQALGREAKCGVELRPFIPALYGGYFYTRGIDEGLDRYREVREAVSGRISPTVDVALKRGCSKYEMALGPSDRWQITADQARLEAWLKTRVSRRLFEWEVVPSGQPAVMVDLVRTRWTQWALQHQQATAKDGTDGRPFARPAVSYHDNPEAVGRVRAATMLASAAR